MGFVVLRHIGGFIHGFVVLRHIGGFIHGFVVLRHIGGCIHGFVVLRHIGGFIHRFGVLRHILVECFFSDTMGSFLLFTFSDMGWSTEEASDFVFSMASTSSASLIAFLRPALLVLFCFGEAKRRMSRSSASSLHPAPVPIFNLRETLDVVHGNLERLHVHGLARGMDFDFARKDRLKDLVVWTCSRSWPWNISCI